MNVSQQPSNKRRIRPARRSLFRRICTIAIAGLLVQQRVDGVNKSWIGGDGLWSVAANWNPAGVPVATDQAILTQGAFTATYTSAVPPVQLGALNVGNGMTLVESSGLMQTLGFNLGINNSSATFLMTGGVATVSNGNIGSNGASQGFMNFTGGTFSAGNFAIGAFSGGTGTLIVNANAAVLAGSMSMNFSGGGGGFVQQNGGSLVFGSAGSGLMHINSLSRFDYNGGLFQGSVRLNAGSVNINISNGTNTLLLQFGGGWIQSGGTLNIGTNALTIASGSTDTYTMTGGHMNGDRLFVGNGNVGGLTQNGGSITTNTFILGQNSAFGGYGLSGAGTASFDNFTISAASGVGSFNQSGGTVTVANNMTVASGTQVGTYIISGGATSVANRLAISTGTGQGHVFLNGGQLSAGSIDIQAGGSLNIAAGTITPSTHVVLNGGFLAPFTNRGPMTVNSGTLDNLTNLGSVMIGGTATIGFIANNSLAPVGINIPTGTALNTAMQNNGVIDINGGALNMIGAAILSNGTTAPATLLLSSGTLKGPITVGGGAFSANVLQSGGLHTGVQDILSTNGRYELTGGVLAVNSIDINGGELELDGGVITSTINLSSGTLSGNGTTPVLGTTNQTGGTLVGTLNNSGTYNFTNGTVPGAIINNGVLNAGANFVVGGGITNYTTINISLGQTLTAGGAGIDNLGSLTLTGGALAGSAVINNFGATMNARGTVAAPFTNSGQLNLSGALFVAGAATNNGIIALTSGNVLSTSGGLANRASGIMHGSGLVNGTVSNSGGLIIADGPLPLTISALAGNTAGGELRISDGATLNANAPFASAGLIALQGADSTLNGGSITNTGTIRGQGRISNSLSNNGIVRVEGGDLDLTGPGISNGASGQMQINSGHTLFVSQGLGSNAGAIALIGGVFDNNGNVLSNAGLIHGFGTVRSGGIVNGGDIALATSSSSVFGSLVNNANAMVAITANGSATFFGSMTNNAGSTVRVDAGSTAVFLGDVVGLDAITGEGTKFYGAGATGGQLASTGTTIVESGANITPDAVNENVVVVRGKLNITPNESNASANRIGALTISGGTLDLADNDLLIETTPSPTIRSYVVQARNGGAWDRTGITSSTAKSHPQHATTLGLIDGARYLSVYGAGATFGGLPVAASNTLIKYTWYGDTDFNGVVNFDDYARIDAGFNNGGTDWLGGDFDLNGAVNFDDYALIDLAFNTQSGTLVRAMDYLEGEDRSMRGMNAPELQKVVDHFQQFGNAYATSFLTSVPEPTTLSCIALTSLALSRKRRSWRGV